MPDRMTLKLAANYLLHCFLDSFTPKAAIALLNIPISRNFNGLEVLKACFAATGADRKKKPA